MYYVYVLPVGGTIAYGEKGGGYDQWVACVCVLVDV